MSKNCITDEHLMMNAAEVVWGNMDYQKKRRHLEALDAFQGMYSNQGVVSDSNTDFTRVKVYWDELCSTTTVACDTSCTPDVGVQHDGIQCTELSLTQCVQSDFSLYTAHYKDLEGFKTFQSTD